MQTESIALCKPEMIGRGNTSLSISYLSPNDGFTVTDFLMQNGFTECYDFITSKDQRILCFYKKDQKLNVMPVLFDDELLFGEFILAMIDSDTKQIKGFHCENCARDWTDWFVVMQGQWRKIHHAEWARLESTLEITKPTVYN